MKNLKQLLTQPLSNVPLKGAIILLTIALLGFVDASYLTIEHFRNTVPPCTTDGCEQVLTSTYSEVFGIPVSLGGAIFYLIVLVGIFAYIDTKKTHFLKWSLMLSVPAFLATLYFVFLQFFVLKAICIYCMGSALTSTLLFVGTIWVFSKYRTTDTLTE